MDGQKISTQPFAHKLHPIVSHLMMFSSGFLSIYGFFPLLPFSASKQFTGAFLFGESKKYQHMNRLRFLYSLHLFIIQNRFKNNVNTLLLVGCCFSFFHTRTLIPLSVIFYRNRYRENWSGKYLIPFNSLVFCLSIYSFSYLFMVCWVVAVDRPMKFHFKWKPFNECSNWNKK